MTARVPLLCEQCLLAPESFLGPSALRTPILIAAECRMDSAKRAARKRFRAKRASLPKQAVILTRVLNPPESTSHR